jgi:hypothetical protein
MGLKRVEKDNYDNHLILFELNGEGKINKNNNYYYYYNKYEVRIWRTFLKETIYSSHE